MKSHTKDVGLYIFPNEKSLRYYFRLMNILVIVVAFLELILSQ